MEKCPICSKSTSVSKLDGEKIGESVLRCNICGLIFLAEVIDKDSPSETNYSESFYTQYLSSKRSREEITRYKNFFIEFSKLYKELFRPDTFALKVYDVGAGDGSFLKSALDEGYLVGGSELSSVVAQLCEKRSGIQLQIGDIGDFHLPFDPDVITLWCVLAHVNDVNEFMCKLSREMNDQTVLFISTPRYCLIDWFSSLLRCINIPLGARILHRRLNLEHRRLFSDYAFQTLVDSHSLKIVKHKTISSYSLMSDVYLQSLEIKGPVLWFFKSLFDLVVRLRLAPKNVSEYYLIKD